MRAPLLALLSEPELCEDVEPRASDAIEDFHQRTLRFLKVITNKRRNTLEELKSNKNPTKIQQNYKHAPIPLTCQSAPLMLIAMHSWRVGP